MTERYTLAAELRGRTGKGGARETRRGGKVPGVVYGSGTPPLAIAVDGNTLRQHLKRAGFMSHVFTLSVGDRTEQVLPRDVQHHPINGEALHVDFLRVSATTEVTVDVEVAFLNQDKSPGLKRGGVLNIVAHRLEVACKPDAIPEQIVVDLAGMEIGDVVHAGDLKLPAGVALSALAADDTIASIAAPTTEAAAPAEGEEAPAEAKAS